MWWDLLANRKWVQNMAGSMPFRAVALSLFQKNVTT
jgi:hypothetical protein